MKLQDLAIWRKAPAVNGQDQAPMQPVAQTNVAIPAAQATIAQVKVPSKATKAWSITKENLPRVAYSVALVAAIALLGFGISAGAASSLAIAGYSLAGAALLGAGIYEYKKATNLDTHAKELFNAVKEFDDLNPLSNKYATAQERFVKAKATIENDLVRLNPSDKNAFVRRIALAAKDNNFRINTDDGRYGIVLENTRGATFEEFVSSIVDAQVEQVKVSYDEKINGLSETFAKEFKNKDIHLSRKIRHLINEAAYKVAGEKEFRMLGKALPDVSQDLLDAIKDKLGGKYIKNEMKKLESLMKDRYGFWSVIDSFRKTKTVEFNKRYDAKNLEIKNLEKQLKALDDAEKGMEKEKISLRAIVRKTNNSPEKIQDAETRITELDARRKELVEQKDAVRHEIDSIKQEQAEVESVLGYEYLIDLNARRRELARLVGIGQDDQENDLVDLEMPAHPTYGDKVKHWAPRVVIGTAAAAALSAGAYYGAPYVKPYVDGDSFVGSNLSKAYGWTKAGALDVGGWISDKAMGAWSYVHG